MTLKNTADRWGPVSQAFHWIIVLMILGLAVVGLVMDELPKTPKYFWVFTAHKSMGITVLVLMLLRLAWRLYAGAPAPVPGMPAWQRMAASLTHWALYGLALAMPLSGWLYDSAEGLRPFKYFGLFTMPKLVAPSESLADLGHDLHENLFWVLVLLVAVHAGAAFYHHLFQRDATLTRMLPRGRVTPSDQQEPRKDVA